MKMLMLFFVWLLGSSAPAPVIPALVRANAADGVPPRELCQLRGTVYVTDRPEDAHYRVYIEEYETSADLLIYAEENALFADQPGVWHFTEKKAFADFRIYLSETRAFADFSIAYTDVASFAGCR